MATATNRPDGSPQGLTTSKNKLSPAGRVVVVGAVLLWVGLAAILLVNADTKDGDMWTHFTFVFASVQAIASAAAGALFGNAVQKVRV